MLLLGITISFKAYTDERAAKGKKKKSISCTCFTVVSLSHQQQIQLIHRKPVRPPDSSDSRPRQPPLLRPLRCEPILELSVQIYSQTSWWEKPECSGVPAAFYVFIALISGLHWVATFVLPTHQTVKKNDPTPRHLRNKNNDGSVKFSGVGGETKTHLPPGLHLIRSQDLLASPKVSDGGLFSCLIEGKNNIYTVCIPARIDSIIFALLTGFPSPSVNQSCALLSLPC